MRFILLLHQFEILQAFVLSGFSFHIMHQVAAQLTHHVLHLTLKTHALVRHSAPRLIELLLDVLRELGFDGEGVRAIEMAVLLNELDGVLFR